MLRALDSKGFFISTGSDLLNGKIYVFEVERVVEKVVEVPKIKKIVRVKYLRNPLEFAAVGFAGLIIGLLIGLFL